MRLLRTKDRLPSRLTERLPRPSRRALKLGLLLSTMLTQRLSLELNKKMLISLLRVSKSDKKKKQLLLNDLDLLSIICVSSVVLL
jgi:hypothetical protein